MSKVENVESIIDRFGPHLHDAPFEGWRADRKIDKVVDTHCPYCGMQCGMKLLVEKNHVVGLEPRYDFPVNEGRLCPKGVTAYLQTHHPDRLLYPLIKRNGNFERASWEEAFDLIVAKFKGLQEKYGKDSIAVYSGSSLTTEKTYLVGKFARLGLGTRYVDYNGRLCMASAQVRPLSERRFFTWMSVAMAAVAFAGFARTYYLAGFHDAPTPVLTPVVHLHGALCTAWILLLIAQTQLIANGRRDIHKLLGSAGVLLGSALVVTGVYVALHSQRRVHTPATADTLADPYVFLVFPTFSVGMFAVFATLGVLKRHRPEAHKRFMMLATANMLIPALARITTQATQGAFPGVVGAAVLINVFLVAMAIHDLRTRGKLHAVTLWGGGIVVISEVLRFAIGYSAPWQAFARAVMG